MKVILIVATTCQILTLKCTKFDFGWGAARDPAGEFTTLTWPSTAGGERDWLPLPVELTMSWSSEIHSY